MSTRKAKVRFNYRDYCLLPEDKRYELIGGEFHMAPSPSIRHQTVLRTLESLIWPFVRDNGLGQVYFAPVDVMLSDEDVVQPDLIYIASEHESIITDRGSEGPPDLVVEVLSPSTRERDRELKRKLYAKYGVREYWLVDPEEEVIEVMTPGTEDFVSQDIYTRNSYASSQVVPGLSLSISQIFQVR